MIDIFKSPNSDKTIIAIDPDSDGAVSIAGEMGLIVGSTEFLTELRIALDKVISPESTSMRDVYPTVKEMCDSIKAKPAINWPSHHKAEIMCMVADGKYPREIAKLLGMKESSVKHLVYHEKKLMRLRKIAHAPFDTEDHRKPKFEETIQKAVIPMGKAESPAKEPTTRQDRIDAIIQMGSRLGLEYITIAAQINNDMGGQWLPDDVSKRLAELRGETRPSGISCI
jgi:DNA-binding CsgD family transcriptional regulator